MHSAESAVNIIILLLRGKTAIFVWSADFMKMTIYERLYHADIAVLECYDFQTSEDYYTEPLT